MKTFLRVGIVLYIISLFLPGIIYKPSLLDNYKSQNTLCMQTLDGYIGGVYGKDTVISCLLNSHGPQLSSRSLTITEVQKLGSACYLTDSDFTATSLSPDKAAAVEAIKKWCVGYDVPAPVSPDYGWQILLFGWAGIFLGMFAWYSNVLLLVSIARKDYKFSIFAFLLGLQAFYFSIKPLDEAGVKNYYVDHLGFGYYLWLAAMISFAIYYFKLKNLEDRRT